MNRATTQWAHRMSVPETRLEAIADALSAYRLTHDIGRAAWMIEVSRRTLERWMVKDEDLRAAIEKERSVRCL